MTLISAIAKAEPKWVFANSPEYLKAFAKANDKLKRTIDSRTAFAEFLTARDLGYLQAAAKKKDALKEFQADLGSFVKLVNPRLEEVSCGLGNSNP